MSRENVEIVGRSTTLFTGGDVASALELFHPDVEWVLAREHPDARTLIGHEALVAYMREWQELLPDLRYQVDRTLDAGEMVVQVGTASGTGAGSGADVSVPLAFLFTVRDGLVTRVEEYLDRKDALASAGLAE